MSVRLPHQAPVFRSENKRIKALLRRFFFTLFLRLTLFSIRHTLYVMAWPVDFYEDAAGNAPVQEFLDGLTEEQRAKCFGLIKMLKEHGPTLPFPYSSQVQGKLRELRTRHGKTRLRILYFADANREFQLLHAVVKETEKLEASDIQKGQTRMADHEQRLKTRKKGR